MMCNRKTTVAALLLLALSLLLCGCGGGGGGAAAPQAPSTYTLSGKALLNGSGLAGVTVTMVNGASASSTTVSTDGSGAYQGALPNGSYTITPSLSGYTFVPQSQTITVSGGNVEVPQDFTATANVTSFTVSGKVTLGGSALPGVTVTIAGAGSGTATTDAGGNYSFSGVRNGSCTITPLLNGYTFSPLSQSVTVNGGNVTVSDFAATAVGGGESTYIVSGKVTLNGTGLAGVSVTIGGAAVGTLTTDTSGSFTFTGVRNGAYTITPTVAGYLFTPTSRAVTVAGGDVVLSDFSSTRTGSITVEF